MRQIPTKAPDSVDIPIPTSPQSVTPQFLTSALQTCFPGTVVTWCSREFLTGEQGMSGAVLLRVHLGGNGPTLPAGLPESVIVKLPPTDPAFRAQHHAMGFFEREVTCYRTLLARTPVDSPTCYAAEFDPSTGHAFLLLEDLTAARNGSSIAGSTIDEVEVVLLALARMHAAWWEDGSLSEQPWARLPSMLAPSGVADVFEQSWPQFLSRLSIPIDTDVLATKDWISSTLHEASTRLFETGPRTLIHNDVQADNLFFTEDAGRPLVFIDWQLMTYARGVVDVANFVRGSLEPGVRRRYESDLLRGYHEALVRAGVRNYSLAQCEADYDLAAVLAPGRLASAVGVIPNLSAHPGAAWDTLFRRLMRAPDDR